MFRNPLVPICHIIYIYTYVTCRYERISIHISLSLYIYIYIYIYISHHTASPLGPSRLVGVAKRPGSRPAGLPPRPSQQAGRPLRPRAVAIRHGRRLLFRPIVLLYDWHNRSLLVFCLRCPCLLVLPANTVGCCAGDANPRGPWPRSEPLPMCTAFPSVFLCAYKKSVCVYIYIYIYMYVVCICT